MAKIIPHHRYRLTEVREDCQLTEAYSYDANGNRTNITSVHRDINNQSATYATGDQLQSQGNTSYSYDANGRLSSRSTVEEGTTQLTTYVYSSLGQLLQVDTPDQSIAYRHNALGQRVAKLVNGQITEKYLWRDLTTLLAVYDANGNVKQRFEHTLGHTPTSFTQEGRRYFIQSDHLGSSRVITDSNGNIIKAIDYDSYGNVIEDTNPDFEIPFGFAGGLHDRDTGLIRFGFRDYDPETGRWTARDPIGFAGGDTNLYGYVLGDPVNGVDLLGLYLSPPGGFNSVSTQARADGMLNQAMQSAYSQLSQTFSLSNGRPSGGGQMNRSPYAPGGKKNANYRGDQALCKQQCVVDYMAMSLITGGIGRVLSGVAQTGRYAGQQLLGLHFASNADQLWSVFSVGRCLLECEEDECE